METDNEYRHRINMRWYCKIIDSRRSSVEVTTPIAIIGEENEDVEVLIEKNYPLLPEVQMKSLMFRFKRRKRKTIAKRSSSTQLQGTDRIKITPRARRIAEENDLDITQLSIVGTGFQGGICARDNLNFLE